MCLEKAESAVCLAAPTVRAGVASDVKGFVFVCGREGRDKVSCSLG